MKLLYETLLSNSHHFPYTGGPFYVANLDNIRQNMQFLKIKKSKTGIEGGGLLALFVPTLY